MHSREDLHERAYGAAPAKRASLPEAGSERSEGAS
jgi:hypothetical protein